MNPNLGYLYAMGFWKEVMEIISLKIFYENFYELYIYSWKRSLIYFSCLIILSILWLFYIDSLIKLGKLVIYDFIKIHLVESNTLRYGVHGGSLVMIKYLIMKMLK